MGRSQVPHDFVPAGNVDSNLEVSSLLGNEPGKDSFGMCLEVTRSFSGVFCTDFRVAEGKLLRESLRLHCNQSKQENVNAVAFLPSTLG